MTARALIVAAPGSGCGKTTITLAILAALKRRGMRLRSAKVGPDYIDPGFHAAVLDIPSVNLDTWAMSPALIEGLVHEASRDADLLVIEGVMGLFDGTAGTGRHAGSTADLAAQLGVPVLLVLDVSGQSQSAAAVVRGFATYDGDVHIAGVVLNRVGSNRHAVLVADAIKPLGIPLVGSLLRDKTLAIPNRHLGLVQANEQAELGAQLARLADLAEQRLDLDALLELARPIRTSETPQKLALPPPGQRIALASDAAFSFVYPHMIDAWRRAGAEIIPFSPLADQAPREDCDTCWLPGGYPELHAATLAAADRFRLGLLRFASTRNVHGECGGYMVLGEGLEDAKGVRHPMVGLLGHSTSFAERKLHLGYRQSRLLADCVLGPSGCTLRGHEFHYATLTQPGKDDLLLTLSDASGQFLGEAGGRRGRVSGSFFHVIARQEPT
jgi:cobyrinic acid a,c-diamide synthase